MGTRLVRNERAGKLRLQTAYAYVGANSEEKLVSKHQEMVDSLRFEIR